ncbi:MAG TPA: RNA polymerase sigma factor [Candidatus Angelobacter sp.]|jgi:RNA polymerase sigma-70 factor (ECF subfamily)|nr:RNA polymerase sigma factor [Candidatus Angelobacter sp.]
MQNLLAKHFRNNTQERRAIRAAGRGDPAAFQFIYEKYRSYVYSICLRMTHDPSLAEDLTQDVFLHVWRKISSFKGQSLFRTWLYRVTANMVLLYFRRQRGNAVPLNSDTIQATELEMAEHWPQLGLEESLSLRNTLEGLSPRYRSVVLLHDLHGYKHHDIARMLGITSGASRSQLHKARVKLRGELRLEQKAQSEEFALSPAV